MCVPSSIGLLSVLPEEVGQNRAQPDAQRAAPARQKGFECFDAYAHQVGGLPVAQPLVVTEGDGNPLLVGKLGEGFVDVPSNVPCLQVRNRRWFGILGFRDVVQSHFTGASELVEAEVERDPMEPGWEASSGLPLGCVPPEAQERVLCHILGGCRLAEQTRSEG
jgi:hypothetical protein